MKIHALKPTNSATFAVLGVAVLHASSSLLAAPVNKETTGTDLTAGTSWVGGIAPGSGDVATWAGGTALGGALAIGSDQSWQGIDIQSATGAITTSGAGILTLGSSGITLAGGGVDLTLGNAVSIGAVQSWQIGDGRTLTASGIVSGGSALTVNGNATGILFLTGNNTFTGGTTLQAGSIRIQHNNGLGTGSLGVNGGAIGSDNNTRTLPNAININGNVRIGGTGFGTGAVVINGDVNLGAAVRTIEAIPTAVVAATGAGTIINGLISNGGITKSGAGILTVLNNSNAYTGATTIDAGTFVINQKSIAQSASVTINGTGALTLTENGAGTHDINNLNGASGSSIRTDFNITGTATARTLRVNQTTDGTHAGTFSQGTGARVISLEKAGSAILSLTNTANAYTGSTAVNAGTLRIGGAGRLNSGSYAGGVSIAGGATLHYDSSATQLFSGILSGGGTLKASGGILRLTGANTFSGQIVVSGGDVVLDSLDSESGEPSVQMSGGRLLLASPFAGQTATIGNLTGTGGLINPMYGSGGAVRTLQVNQTVDGEFGGTIQDATSGEVRLVGLTKTGAATLALTANNTYSGATSVNDGTLLINGTQTGTGLITVSSGATLGGSGSVSQVLVSAGGTLAPGNSAGNFTITGPLDFDPAAILSLELGAPSVVQSPGTDFVTVGGALTLGGTINLTAITGFGTPVAGDKWLVMTSEGGIADNGVAIGSAPALGAGLTFALDADDGENVFLTVVPEAGSGALILLALAVLRIRRAITI